MSDATTLTGETGKVLGNLQLKTVLLDKGAIVNLISSTASDTIETVRGLITGAYRVKGNLSNAEAFSGVSDPDVGDVYNMGYSGSVTSGYYNDAGGWDGAFLAGDNLVYTTSGWDKLAGSVDTSAFIDSVSGGTGIDVSRSSGSSVVTISLDATTQASLGLADSSLQGVKLAGGSSALSAVNGVVEIPNAVASGVTGATNGLLTAADKLKIDTIPQAGTVTPNMDGTADVGSGTKWAREDHVHPTDTSRAPTDHASSGTTYGIGTASLYGHVMLSDSTSGVTTASSGVAATPKAVSDALSAAKTYAESLTPDLSSRIKKATVLSGLNNPSSTPSLPSGYDDLTVNQFLYAVYAGASESES